MKSHEQLTMQERAQVIREGIARGIRSLDEIWALYDQQVQMVNQQEQQYPQQMYQPEPQDIQQQEMPMEEEIQEETPPPTPPVDLREQTRQRALDMFANNTSQNFTTEKLQNAPQLYEAPSTPLQEQQYTDTPQLTNQFDDGGDLKEEVYDAGTLPTAVVVTNYPSEEDIKSNIESQWASAKNLPFYNITKDNTFTREKTGAGSIEYFNEPAITYNNGVTVNNPNSNPTILFDPNTNTVEDIKLDLLHHYREYDPVYKDKLNRYQNALLSNPNTASEVLWNSLLGQQFIENYAEKDEQGNLLRDNNGNFIIKDEYQPIWDKLVDDNLNNNSFIIQGVDGSLRNLLTSDQHAKTNNYAPIEEARKQWLRDKEANIAFEDLKDYIINGKKALGGNLYPEGGAIYTVQQGDVLGSIAKRYNTTVNEILAVNKGMNPDKLALGQKINIPKPKPEEPKRDFKTNGPINNQQIAQRQAYVESTYNPKNYNSGSQAAGLFQITPIVLKEYNERNKSNLQAKDLYDPVINAQVRNWYINKRLPQFQVMQGQMGDSIKVARALASYNWGASHVNDAIKKAQAAGINVTDGWKWLDYLPAETRNYVNFILRNKDLKYKTDKDMQLQYAKFIKQYPNYKFKAEGGNLLYDGGDENNPGEEVYWGNENFGYLPTTTVTAKAPTRWDEFSKDFRQFFTGKDQSNYVWDQNAGRYRYEKVADNPLDQFRYSEKRRAREQRYLDRYNRQKEIIEENPQTYGVAEKSFWGLPYSTAESIYAGLNYLTGNKAAGDAIWDHINNEVAPQQIAPLAITIGTLGLGEGINAVAGPIASNIFNTSVLGLFGSQQAKDLEEKTNGFTTTENLTPEDYVNTALMLGLPSAKYLEGMSGEQTLSLMQKGANFIKQQPLYDAYIKAVQQGDMKTAQALRDQHFAENTPNSVLIDNGNPMDLYHSTNNLFTVPNTTNNPKGSSSSFGPGFYTAPAENLAKQNNIMMRLYGNMENPNIIWTIEDWLKANNDFSFGDGVIARKTNRRPLPETFTDIVFREPNQVKLADPVTYFKADDPEVLSGQFKEGDVIPLWMRDDFSRNDIRFNGKPLSLNDALQTLSDEEFSKIAGLPKSFFDGRTELNKFQKLWDSRYKRHIFDSNKRDISNTNEAQIAKEEIKNFLKSDWYKAHFDNAAQWESEMNNQNILLDHTPTYLYEESKPEILGFYDGNGIHVDNSVQNGNFIYPQQRSGVFKHETGHASSGAGEGLSEKTQAHNKAIQPAVRTDVGLSEDQIRYLSHEDEIRTRFLNVASDMIAQGKDPMEVFEINMTKYPNSDYFDVLQNYVRDQAIKYMKGFRSLLLPATITTGVGLSAASTDNQQSLGGHLQNKQ